MSILASRFIFQRVQIGDGVSSVWQIKEAVFVIIRQGFLAVWVVLPTSLYLIDLSTHHVQLKDAIGANQGPGGEGMLYPQGIY